MSASKTATDPKTLSKIKKAKTAILATVLRDRGELIDKLNQAARSTILYDALNAEMNAEIEAVKARFTKKLDAHQTDIETAKTSVQSFCETNRADLFGDKKTLTLPGGHVVAFRDNGGAVETIGRVSQKTVLDRLIAHEEEDTADLFVTWKPSLDKAVIQSKFPDHKDFLTKVGLKIEHSETFKIDLSIQAGAATSTSHETTAAA